MNARKIFKAILGVGALAGTAYVAYKTGYQDGKNANLPENHETDNFNDIDDSDDSDDDFYSLNDVNNADSEKLYG